MAKQKVIILGGGVAGLSAAHELIRRDYDVTVYEMKAVPGGKARSVDVPDSATDGRKKLPGEHGFRFFPRFYRHVTATMKEIPFKGKTVFDNLVDTSEIRIARFGEKSFFMPSRFPTSMDDIKKLLEADRGVSLGLSTEEISYFSERVWQLMTSCKDRRRQEYERMGWWEFVEADRFSDKYKTLLAQGLTRTLVAAKAELVSTKTGGDILLQLMFDIIKPGISSDRILNGPTNEVWIEPWLDDLKKRGVNYQLNSKVKEIKCIRPDKVKSVVVEQNGKEIEAEADFFISALPVEVMAGLLNQDMLNIDPTLENVKLLSDNVLWMNGLQLYLTEDVKINHGHTIYVDSPWAITSISQTQFWGDFDWSKHGDGNVKGIISVDISNWFAPGILYGKCAKDCTTEEIAKEVWAQLKKSLNIDSELITDNMLHSWNLDPSIVPGVPTINLEPLLVNNKNTWMLRPYAYCDVANLFLASDYVKTNTDLATMEGANEAARRAVNALIDASGTGKSYCKVWDLHEPWLLFLLKWRDVNRYKNGLPWDGKLPIGVPTLMKIAHKISYILNFRKR